MLSVRDLWRRHRRKIYLTVGVLGGGYFLYKLYGAHRHGLQELERELAVQRESEELVKAQMQAHFENIQRISDVTLPHAMHDLSCRIAEELDLSHLLERLIQGKGQPNTLTQSEKLDLWSRLKILSFTRLTLSVWATTMLSLYTKVQVNILGRHLYIDTARSLGIYDSLESGDVVDREDQKKFLDSVDFLSQHGMTALISDMEAATKEVLKGKLLSTLFNNTTLHETIMQILNTFMSMRSPHSWVKYMIPEDAKSYSTTSGSDDLVPSDMTEFQQLMMETWAVLSSAEFGSIVEISLKAMVDALVELMGAKFGGGSATAGLPLARLLPQVAQMCPLLLEEPSKNQFIQIIKNIHEILHHDSLYDRVVQ
ncbi:peroxisome biogenesis protein 3-2-like isoform X2 [Abrus precatorius]|uniref:Peroxisome biogenesis protein 3-2-like isoform X2 n=1 Tax=Abrus precatorius TaxID=3816 RepID=A0A8B8KFS6_ABRPR|nr:peroxisome biogenesis protein 3-2-like isoform X2 [Abrus precatorius]